MRKQCIFLIVILTVFGAILQASEVRFGERPFINIYEIPDHAMEQGKIRIKLGAELSDYAARLSDTDGFITDFGIPVLDELNQHYNVKSIKKLFYSPAFNKNYSLRHQEWGFHLWFELHYDVAEDIRNIIMAY
ncbi:MAG TPA: subtilase family N-terminal domain-containing protein, partial [Candidatus Cloacimonadota bacterium]|nr:subtilase family N-terminal domain-containing protein [Candidatus Cloacimonadota bacterium]